VFQGHNAILCHFLKLFFKLAKHRLRAFSCAGMGHKYDLSAEILNVVQKYISRAAANYRFRLYYLYFLPQNPACNIRPCHTVILFLALVFTIYFIHVSKSYRTDKAQRICPFCGNIFFGSFGLFQKTSPTTCVIPHIRGYVRAAKGALAREPKEPIAVSCVGKIIRFLADKKNSVIGIVSLLVNDAEIIDAFGGVYP